MNSNTLEMIAIYDGDPDALIYQYGSRYRPMSPSWVRIEGIYAVDWIIESHDARPYHCIVYTAAPLPQEKIDAYELERIAA